MNDKNELLWDKVNEINKIYSSLPDLSNDELRFRINQIEFHIKNTVDEKTSLDNFLPEVFAIVKETARRFSNGDIEVTANSYDRWLAEKYDFVKIRGDKAIYKNKWEVEETPYLWNMVHYDEQLLGGIHLHYGQAIEMATGEGKTLVATLPVFLNALTHKGIHVMTVNDYLSKRDYEITRPIYLFYGLTADCLENYKRGEYEYKESYKKDITFGTTSTFVFDYLFDHLALDKNDVVQKEHYYAIIDELDSILIDEANTAHRVSGGTPYKNDKIFKELLPIIKELLESNEGILCHINTLSKEVSLTPQGEAWLISKLNIPDLYKYRKLYEVDNFKALPQESKEEILINLNKQNVIQQLLFALTVYNKDIDYVVLGGKVIIIDENTGRLKKGTRWSYGLHTAIEVKEEVDVQEDYDGLGIISLKNYFKLYNKISGMSGTIIDVYDELKETYNLLGVKIPTHKPMIRLDEPLRIYKTSIQKDNAIIQAIENNHLNGKPTLIGSLSIKRADEIEQKLKEHNLLYNRLDAKSLSGEAKIIEKAGINNTITLSTAVAGRGTDIKPSKDAIANGGLCVIGTDLFGSRRTDLQLKGRTGRQGNPGQSLFFASLEDKILEYLSVNEKEDLLSLANKIPEENISFDNIRQYFKRAQDIRENILKQKRIKEAQKDDIVAPRRAVFYKQRNSVLFNVEKVDEIIAEILIENNISIEQFNNSILKHYPNVKELIKRSKANNTLEKRTLIPFSENRHPYVIQLDIDLVLTSKTYFIQEFKRQNILQVYDKFWKDYVLYMMQNLDQHEINSLDDKYLKMMNDIRFIINNRLLNSKLLFNILEEDKKTDHIRLEKFNPTHKKIHKEEVCPCGSGKIFGECHGRNVHNIPRRLR